jgi:large subunit ribosomal protein L6
MSRIGKQIIAVPAGVDVTVNANHVKIKGPKGTLEYTFPISIAVESKDSTLIVKRVGQEPEAMAYHGLVRALLNNMVIGVSKGFEKKLEIIGVGYRAAIVGKKLTLSLGYSHPIELIAPEGVVVEMDKELKNVLVISGPDRQAIGQFASNIRRFRPPEPYKGKGIRYLGEQVARKAGKTASAKE